MKQHKSKFRLRFSKKWLNGSLQECHLFGKPREGLIWFLRNKIRIDRCFLVLLILLNLGSCKSEYQQYIDEELASGEVRDSLMLGMRMGQTKKEFFSICWELNKQKIISQGDGSNARMEIDNDTTGGNHKKELLFYGIFDEEEVMRGMRMTYSYISWAPWNQDKQADALFLDLRKQYELGYPGNDFIEIEIKQLDQPALVKIDGNRQILMYPKNDKDVVVKIEDLRHKYDTEK